MVKKSKRVFALAMASCLTLSMAVTGCSKKQEAEQGTNTATTLQPTTNTPYEFSIFRSTWTDLNEETDLVIKEINKKLNVKIRIQTAPYETWVEKYNILVASGQVPDLSVTTGPGTMNFNQWAAQGVFLDITDLYPKHCPDVVKNIKNEIIEAHKINGKLYGIPRPSISDSTYAIRTDWLKNLNLSMPKTLDDLYKVLKAFKENDPDGNKQNDTYGLTTEDTLSTASIIFGAFNVSVPPNKAENWIPDGTTGKLTSCLLAPGMKDAIVYMTKLYRDKILDQEWMMTKSQAYVDKINTGKVGLAATGFQIMISDTEANMKKNDPNAELAILDGVTGPGGKYARPMQSGFYMVSSISSKSKNPTKILEFLNYLMTEEGDNLIRYGVEGVTYTKQDGKIVINNEAAKTYGLASGHKFKQILQPAVISIPGDDSRIPQLKEMAKVLFNGPFYPAPTSQPASLKEVTTKQGADYVKNSITAIITGSDDPAAEWDKFIKNWRETGGDTLIKEINEIYAANTKK